MKWTRSIRVRFALWTTLLILAFLAAFGGLIYFILSLSLHTAIDDALSLGAAQTAANLDVDNGIILVPEPISPNETGFQAFSERGLTLMVLSDTGKILQAVGPYRTRPAPTSTNPIGVFSTLPVANQSDLRVYSLPVFDNDKLAGWVQAMQSLSSVQDTLDRLLLALLLGGSLLSILAGFGGYFLASRALIPIDRITETARRISIEDLSNRLGLPNSGDEVSRLANTFDEMLSRLEDGFQRERQFTADASHELRTPLTAMQAILSVMRNGERSPDEYRQALDDLSDETSRMRGLVEDLLQLARGENETPLRLEPVDLSTLLSDVVDSLRPLADAKKLGLICNLQAALPFTGDMDALIRLFINLIDNAIKYTKTGAITITAQSKEGQIIIKVSDTGIGIPKEHLQHVFERFYRIESARSTAGVGLGLAIAQQIVHAHAGTIRAESQSNRGTTFEIHLPQ